MEYTYTTINDLQIAFPIATRESLMQSGNPYWAKLWHSANAMVTFIKENQLLFTNKRIIELGAGLGLPSLYVAKYAVKVHCTDIEPEAVACVNASIAQNSITNVTTDTLDWALFENASQYDIALISDLNYEPELFTKLTIKIEQMLAAGNQIFLTTPQRLLAKTFVASLAPYIKSTAEYEFNTNEHQHYISLFHLKM